MSDKFLFLLSFLKKILQGLLEKKGKMSICYCLLTDGGKHRTFLNDVNPFEMDFFSKLDIKILMEERDQETINEAKALVLFGSPTKMAEGIPLEEYGEFLKLFDPIIIPGAKVTTKPRACNYGLLRAKGELCVIYDAEDNPDPDQLYKAGAMTIVLFINSTLG